MPEETEKENNTKLNKEETARIGCDFPDRKCKYLRVWYFLKIEKEGGLRSSMSIFFIYAKIFIIIVFASSCFTRPRPYTHEHRDFEQWLKRVFGLEIVVEILNSVFSNRIPVGHFAISWIMLLLWIVRRLHQKYRKHTHLIWITSPILLAIKHVYTVFCIATQSERWQRSMPKQIQYLQLWISLFFREVSVRNIGELKNGSLLHDVVLWMVSLCCNNNYSLQNL